MNSMSEQRFTAPEAGMYRVIPGLPVERVDDAGVDPTAGIFAGLPVASVTTIPDDLWVPLADEPRDC
jgi:hypothetical protein